MQLLRQDEQQSYTGGNTDLQIYLTDVSKATSSC